MNPRDIGYDFNIESNMDVAFRFLLQGINIIVTKRCETIYFNAKIQSILYRDISKVDHKLWN